MHGQVRTTAFQFGVTATTLARSIVVIVLVIVVSIDNVIYFRVRVPSKILGSTRIFFPIVLLQRENDNIWTDKMHVRECGARRRRVCRRSSTGRA